MSVQKHLDELHDIANNRLMGQCLQKSAYYADVLPKKVKLVEEKRIELKKGRQLTKLKVEIDIFKGCIPKNGVISMSDMKDTRIGYTNFKIHEPEKVEYVKLLSDNSNYADIIFPYLTGKDTIDLMSNDMCIVHMNYATFGCEIVCFEDTYLTYEIVEHDGDFSQKFTETHKCHKNYSIVGFDMTKMEMNYKCTYFETNSVRKISSTSCINIDIYNPISKLSLFSRCKLHNVILSLNGTYIEMEETTLKSHRYQKYLYEYSVTFDKYITLFNTATYVEIEDASDDEMFITASLWNLLSITPTGMGQRFTNY